MRVNLSKYVPYSKRWNIVKIRSLDFRRSLCSKDDGNSKKAADKQEEKPKSVSEPEDDQIYTPYNAPKYATDPPTTYMEKMFKEDIQTAKNFFKKPTANPLKMQSLLKQYDIVILGAGPVGSTIAHMIRSRYGESIGVLVIDSDLSDKKYNRNEQDYILAPQLSIGHLTQQFTLKENIRLAQYGAGFIRNLEHDLNLFFDDVKPITFRPCGQLTLATEKGYNTLKESHIIQGKFQTHTELATPYQLSQRYPWLNTDDIALGSIGQLNEGWFDPWEYLLAVRSLAMRRGAIFVEGTPLEFHFRDEKSVGMIFFDGVPRGMYQPCYALMFQDKNGQRRRVEFSRVVIALGSETGKFTKDFLALESSNYGLYQIEVPIVRKKHYVFYFEADVSSAGFCAPTIQDPSGVYVRREGLSNNFICGCTFPMEDPSADNLKVDSSIFTDYIWPVLAHRVPALEKLRLKSGWAYFEDHNKFDGSPVVGTHPGYHNVVITAGLGRHSYLYAPGIGRAVSELVINSDYQTIDLERFGLNRIAQEVPLFESEIL